MVDDEGGKHEAVEDAPSQDSTAQDSTAPASTAPGSAAPTGTADSAEPEASADLDIGAGGATILNKTLAEAAAMGPLPGTAELNAVAERGEDDSLTISEGETPRGTIDGEVVAIPNNLR